MEDIRWKTFWLMLGLLAICAIISLSHSLVAALSFFCVALVVFIAGHLYWIHKLQIWLRKPTLVDVPDGSGIWEHIFSSLFQNQRKNFRTEAELTAALEGFKRATNALPDGVVVLNHRNEIEWCNPPAEMLLGLDLFKDVNQPVQNLVRYNEFISYLHAEDYAEPITVKSLRTEGATLQIQLIIFGTAQKLLICRDISTQEKIDTMRRDFIANVSHELRTPLTVVGGFLETLQETETDVSKEMKGYFDLMIAQTNRMRLIIEDLLTLSKIESNYEVPETSVINIQNILNMIQNDAKALSHDQHHIQLEMQASLNIKGSREEIVSAFTNLVSNAIRYTPAGGDILITWSLHNKQATFSVQDSGIGIDEKHIARLTERFYRVDSSRSRDTGGTGLGLAIVKHILNRHKAKLEIKSRIGKGSTFSIIFPESRTVVEDTKQAAA